MQTREDKMPRAIVVKNPRADNSDGYFGFKRLYCPECERLYLTLLAGFAYCPICTGEMIGLGRVEVHDMTLKRYYTVIGYHRRRTWDEMFREETEEYTL